jgi:hypothetical protein
MLDLLSAGIHRYLKRPLTYLCFAASLICGIMYVITSVETSENVDFFFPDDFYFIFSIIANTILCVMNIGTEFSSGVIRNKISSGHKKHIVYISEVLITVLISTIMFCLTAVPLVAYHIAYLQRMTYMVLSLVIIYTAYIFIGIMVVFVCFVTANRTAAAIIGGLLVFLVNVIGYSTVDVLNEPEFFTKYHQANGDYFMVAGDVTGIDDMDDIVEITQEENPEYPRGIKRDIVTVIHDCNPNVSINSFMSYCYCTNNSEELYEYEKESHSEMVRSEASMCIAAVLITICGALIFKKKNLK